MKTKQLTNNKELLIAGLNKAADVVKSTMGGKGKMVAIADNAGKLEFTKDGVSAAKAISLENPIEDMGAKLAINSANETVEMVGDGTTSTTVLLQWMVNNLPKFNREDIDEVLGKLKSHKLETLEQVYGVTKTASNSPVIGELFREIFEDIGFKSLITLEQSEAPKTYYEVKKGVQFKSGYLSSNFANKPNGDCILENAIVVVDTQKRTSDEQYIEMMETAAKRAQPIVIVSQDFSITTRRLVIGNVQKGFPICLIKAPGFGKQVSENFKDILALRKEDGTVDKIVIKPTTFTVYNENSAGLEQRLKDLDAKWDGFLEDYDKYRLEQRINSLRQTSAIIYAGGLTPKNMKEEFDRIEDALGSISAALEGGFSKGGGLSLLEATYDTPMEEIGRQLNAQIQKNAGLEQVGEEIDIFTGKKIDYLKENIIDATDVIKQSLLNAYASYQLFLNTEFIIYNETNNNPFQGQF